MLKPIEEQHVAPPSAPMRSGAGLPDRGGAIAALRGALSDERGRSRQLELDLRGVREALAQAQVELAGSRCDERRSRHRALHDELTTLPNRSLFGQWLDHTLVQAAPRQERLAVLYLDLDDFKSVNDTHGHDVGDVLLRIVAARLVHAVRTQDVVSRRGGDEFACLLTDVPGRAQLSHMACKLFDAVSAPMQIGRHALTVRASIGIAMCPDDGVSADDLLRHADAAMYHAKRHGGGYAFFDQAPDA